MSIVDAYRDLNESTKMVWAIEASVRDLQADGDFSTGDDIEVEA